MSEHYRGRSTAARRRRRPAGGPAGQRSTGSGPAGSRPAQPAASELDRQIAAALATPAPAAATFADLGLPPRLVAALAGRGVQAPFAIQARALPDALAGRDVLGRAQTGSGKTLAFGLPLLVRLAGAGAGTGGVAGAGGAARREPRSPRGLVLVPTRELAVQVADVLAPLGQVLGLRLSTVYGGVSIGRQIDALRRGVDIVVATPGRLIDLLDRGACALGRVSVTVLDEADHMADLGFLPAVTRILGETPAGGQRLLFSATLDRGVDRLVRAYLSQPAVHAVAAAPEQAEAADHRVFVLPAADKVAVAAEIAARPARTLFFVRTKHGADRLARQLSRAGVQAGAIHGNLNQNRRQRALAAFTAGDPHVLVATDVAARGIHVDDIDLVVHFDLPNDHKDYLHRSGRTARAGATGTVLALVQPDQVREAARLHDAAGVTPTTDTVQAGHRAIRELVPDGAALRPARDILAPAAAVPVAGGAAAADGRIAGAAGATAARPARRSGQRRRATRRTGAPPAPASAAG